MPKPNETFDALLQDKDALYLLSVFADAGYSLRFIGGCVRDSLIGRPIKDIDMATNAVPEQTIDVLKRNNIQAIPTGIDHGTITAIVGKRSFEITTLRADVETDGRHAKVAFTTDWKTDAERRDFTINALSVDAQGSLHDYFDGMQDIQTKNLRFIGDAAKRMQEDYLRILRYFRFASQLNWSLTNQNELSLCDANAQYLSTLSKERLQAEIFKTLEGPAAADIVSLMQKHGIWSALLQKTLHIIPLKKLIALETQHNEPDAFRRLIAFIGIDDIEQIVHVTVLSNKQKNRIQDIVNVREYACNNRTLIRQLYDFGAASVKDYYYIIADTTHFPIIDAWVKPIFPVTAADVMPLTDGEGPLVGMVLKTLENYWIDNKFETTKDQLMMIAQEFIAHDAR